MKFQETARFKSAGMTVVPCSLADDTGEVVATGGYVIHPGEQGVEAERRKQCRADMEAYWRSKQPTDAA